MAQDIQSLRNIGISAHIDAGKTTLTERILYYTKRIHAVHEVKAKTAWRHHGLHGFGKGKRDHHPVRGHPLRVEGHTVNIIDTPGHVDFTIEVERALRVLDGSVLVLCAVAGAVPIHHRGPPDEPLQSAKACLHQQVRPSGASPYRVVDQLRQRLNHNAVLMEIPIVWRRSSKESLTWFPCRPSI